jgi:hypothetical protein
MNFWISGVSAKLRLLNGRFIGDLLGNVTYINE